MIPKSGRPITAPSRKPRASGDDPTFPFGVEYTQGVNPARAGMIPSQVPSAVSATSKPRASGDDPNSVVGAHTQVE